MKKIIKWFAIGSAFVLVGYLSYKAFLNKRFGVPTVEYVRPSQECFSVSNWRYCVHKTNNTDESVYLYVLHGKDQSENFWLKGEFYAGLLQKDWQVTHARTPVVITISFGPLWLITPKMSDPRTGLLDNFKSEIFNVIEHKLGPPQERILMGASMGGLNALTLALHMPEKFARVASLCPPLYDISPFSPLRSIVDFMIRTGAKPQPMSTALGVGRLLFKNEEEWNRFSPLAVLQSLPELKNFPPLYLSCGLWDEFGNFPAVEKFSESATSKGVNVVWRPNSGDHCAVDIQSLANFLKIEAK